MNKIKQYIEERERDFEEEFCFDEFYVCADCGHTKEQHYWNGGRRVENSGYDRCRADKCKCVSDNWEVKRIKTDNIYKNHISQTITGLLDVIVEEIENNNNIVINEARKIIVNDYNEATRRYERAKMEVKEGKKYAEADTVLENAKQVVLSRLEPKVTSAINKAIYDITTKLKTIIK